MLRKFCQSILLLLSSVYLLTVIISFGGFFSLELDLLSHFRMHYFVGGLILLLLSCLLFHAKSLGMNLLGSILNLSMMALAIIPVQHNRETPMAQHQIYSANVLFGNENHALLEPLKQAPYDHILLLETGKKWQKEAQILKEDYPYVIEQPRNHGGGLLFFSKHKFKQEKQVFKSQKTPVELPYIWAEFDDYIFIGLHAITPLSQFASARNEQMDMLATRINAHPNHKFIVMGDFNDTIWSFSFQRFLKKAGLTPTGTGLLPTWPASFLPAGIQIDHALVKGFNHTYFKIGSENGSDHLPIMLSVQ